MSIPEVTGAVFYMYSVVFKEIDQVFICLSDEEVVWGPFLDLNPHSWLCDRTPAISVPCDICVM